MSVVPLEGELLVIFRNSVLETVSEPREITETPDPGAPSEKVLAWAGWSLNTRSWVLSSQAGTWTLNEVVYYLGYESAVAIGAIMIFAKDGSRVAVRVDKATFLAKFAGAAGAESVVHVTIPGSMKHMDAPSQETLSATAEMAAQFPKVAVGFDTVVHGARANTGIAPVVPHIVGRYAGPRSTRTMYFGHDRNPRAYTDLTYGGKRVWTPESLASAPLTLVVGPVLESDGLNDAWTLQAGYELELTRATPTDCFVGGGITFCPATGKLLNGLSEHDLVEILYVPLDLDNAWACVLHFRPVGKGNPQQLAYALRLGPESTEMLMTVVNMRLAVLTSTAIRGLAASLPPWPNAHSQATTNAPVVRSLASQESLMSLTSLMPLSRARMIWAPDSAVVRYEPVPSCADYAGNRTDRKGWVMWPLCSADAAARANSPACGVFKECASQPGASTASLIDARNSTASNDPKDPKDKELVVPLYDSKETGVLYGLTSSAVYVVAVRPPRPRSMLVAQADVVVATEKRTERFLATKEARGFRIVAASPPCAELARCMKGTELSECYLWSNHCAQREDRSPIAARLEYNGAIVELRELDAEVLYGIDSRGAFALHVGTGSVILAPGIKQPAWPRVDNGPLNQGAPVVLKATYDAGTWRVGSAPKGESPKGESPKGESPKGESYTVWIIVGVAFAVVVILVGIYIALSKRAKSG